MSTSGKKKKPAPRAGKKKKTTPEIEHIGDRLRSLRQERGLSIREVSDATRISVTNITAIETQDFSALPADTFTRGLLTIYAKFLDQEADLIVNGFLALRNESMGQDKSIWSRQRTALPAPKRLAEPIRFSSISMAGLLLVIITVLFTAFCLYTSWNPFSFFFKDKSEPDITVPLLGREQLIPAAADSGADDLTTERDRKEE